MTRFRSDVDSVIPELPHDAEKGLREWLVKSPGSMTVDSPPAVVGNKLLTLLSNMFTNLDLSDMETCYKVFRREVIQRVAPTLKERRFGIEPELTAKVASLPGVRIFERPISYSGRTYRSGLSQ